MDTTKDTKKKKKKKRIIKNRSAESLKKKYDKYVEYVTKWAKKGYATTLYDESEFKEEYEKQRKIASRHHDTGKNTLRQMAADSRELTRKQMRDLSQMIEKKFEEDAKEKEKKKALGEKVKEEEKEKKSLEDISKMSRLAVWNYLFDLNNEDYDTSHAQYNEVF